MGMVVHVAEPGIGSEVLGISSGVDFQVVLRSFGAISFQKPRHLPIFIGLIESCSIKPASVVVTTVL